MALFSIVITYLPCMLFFAGVVSQLFLIVEERKWKKKPVLSLHNVYILEAGYCAVPNQSRI